MGTDQRAEVWAKTSGYCWYCGRLMNPWSNFTIDHMDPRIQGGGDNLSNLVPCCKICNSRKGGKTVIEYKEYLANKDEHTFWFEHDETLLKAYDNTIEPIDEEAEMDDAMPMHDLSSIVYFCIRLGGLLCNTGVTATLIYLLEEGLDNCQENPEEDGYVIEWPLDIHNMAFMTGQAVHLILSHVFFMQEQNIIEITGKNPPERSIYTLHTKRIQQVVADHRKAQKALEQLKRGE